MLKTLTIALTLALASTTPALAQMASYTTAETTIGVLLEDAAAKAILDKHIPGLTDNPSIAMAGGMTLKALQAVAGDKVTDDMLAAVDADFKAMKAAK